jgi:hypothetical protein
MNNLGLHCINFGTACIKILSIAIYVISHYLLYTQPCSIPTHYNIFISNSILINTPLIIIT